MQGSSRFRAEFSAASGINCRRHLPRTPRKALRLLKFPPWHSACWSLEPRTSISADVGVDHAACTWCLIVGVGRRPVADVLAIVPSARGFRPEELGQFV